MRMSNNHQGDKDDGAFDPFQRHGGGRFEERYRCYPIVLLPGKEREALNYGGKIILPPSALERLSMLNIQYPMLFEISNLSTKQSTHCGVLEFIAEEGKVYLPQWMMQTLLAKQGDLIVISSTNLSSGQFVKIQPQSVDFIEISDPRAVLENALRNFSTLTVGDIIAISYNKRVYELLVLEIKPNARGICIVETDLEVDFAPPKGYVEPDYKKMKKNASEPVPEPEQIVETASTSAFKGSGFKLNGKPITNANKSSNNSSSTSGLKPPASLSSSFTGSPKTPIPFTPANPYSTSQYTIPAPLHMPPGKLYFGYRVIPLKNDKEAKTQAEQPFTGEGKTLNNKPPKKVVESAVPAPTPAATSTAPSSASDVDFKPFAGSGRSLK